MVNFFFTKAQLLSVEESKIDSMIMRHIDEAVIDFDELDVIGSSWVHLDGMGERSIKFSKRGYKLKWNGAQGKYESRSGKWYIYKKYLVVSHKGEKKPLFMVRKNGRIILIAGR